MPGLQFEPGSAYNKAKLESQLEKFLVLIY